MIIPTIKNAVLGFVFLIAFIVVLGELPENSPMTWVEFILLKLAALVAMLVCFQLWGVMKIKDIFKEENSHEQ